jgi:CRISPR-associated protein Cmr6
MSDYKIPIPQASQSAFRANIGRSLQNAGLIFERYAPDTKDDSKLKADGLQAVLSAFERADKKLLEEWNRRWEQTIRAAEAEAFPMQTDWRLIAGLGKKGSLEVGFTFHRYGFPYLPGSSLKGLARAYGLLEIALMLEAVIKAKNEKDPISKLDKVLSLEDNKKYNDAIQNYDPNSDVLDIANGYRQIFGTTETAGKAIFFDAIPSAKFPLRLELDIMNPHYPDYYKDMGVKEPREYPTNWQSPIPVQFLTVASNSVFRFAIGWRNSYTDKQENSEKKQVTWIGWFKGEQVKKEASPNSPRMIKLARRWLQGGLIDLGVGGKTSAGYGYFKDAS